MTRPLTILWLLVVAVALGGGALSWRACAVAGQRSMAQARRLEALTAMCDQIDTLRAGVLALPASSADEGGLAARVTATLGAAGLPSSALASLSPTSENLQSPSGAVVVRRKAALSLTAVRLPELGSFLGRWRAAEPRWVVSSIELAPDPSAAVTPGADVALRINLVMESLVTESTGGSS